MRNLFTRRIAVLIADEFSVEGMIMCREAMTLAGAEVDLIGPMPLVTMAPQDRIRCSRTFFCDQLLSEVQPDSYQGIVLIGGVGSGRILRQDPWAAEIISRTIHQRIGMGIIADGLLAITDLRLLHGRKVAAPDYFRCDLIHAGAEWTDEPIARDRGVVSCASLSHFTEFIPLMIEAFADQATMAPASTVTP